MKLLFVHDSKYDVKDGLWAALNLLEKQGFEISKMNLQSNSGDELTRHYDQKYDFVLGWGAFHSPVDDFLMTLPNFLKESKIGLCIGGTPPPGPDVNKYNVLFYETEWFLPQIQHHKNVVHAFGINSDIYKSIPDCIKVWDWLSVGAFALWKRQYLLKNKGGYRLAIGEIQKKNMSESIDIIGDLLLDGICISDMVEPEKLAMLYNSSDRTFIGADINGGGERAVLESRACGTPVTVEKDNPKLQELCKSPIWNEYYYSNQLKKGIESCF